MYFKIYFYIKLFYVVLTITHFIVYSELNVARSAIADWDNEANVHSLFILFSFVIAKGY